MKMLSRSLVAINWKKGYWNPTYSEIWCTCFVRSLMHLGSAANKSLEARSKPKPRSTEPFRQSGTDYGIFYIPFIKNVCERCKLVFSLEAGERGDCRTWQSEAALTIPSIIPIVHCRSKTSLLFSNRKYVFSRVNVFVIEVLLAS